MAEQPTHTAAAPLTEPGAVRVRRALLSVSDKRGLVDFARGLSELGFRLLEPSRLPDGTEVVTPVVPVVVGDDWKAVFLWKALYEAGVYVNVAIHPAVPPAGALLRTSVMATHDHDTLDVALERVAAVQAAFQAEHGPLPAPQRA